MLEWYRAFTGWRAMLRDTEQLDEILLRCEKAGPEFCRLAGYGDPQDLYAEIKATLREEPLRALYGRL